MEEKHVSVRRRIVQAGLQLVEEDGIASLTQTQVAKRSGVRQSHLTYYFPKVTDLLLAIFAASHERAEHSSAAPLDPLDAMRAVMFDADRMRFFLKVAAEVSSDRKLRFALCEHAASWARNLGPFFGRSPDDPDLLAFIDLIRGRAVRHLLEGQDPPPTRADLLALATRLSVQDAE